jgi:hypothetical protein
MAKETVGRVIELSKIFNRQLKRRVLELEDIGVETSVPELIVKYAEIGFNIEGMNIKKS